MTKYARGTTVSADRSLAEIRRLLQRYGADGFQPTEDWVGNRIAIQFSVHGRLIRFVLPLRKVDDFRTTPAGRRRTQAGAETAWEQDCRERFRALALSINAKLETVESGIATFDEEFLSRIVDPGTGKTVAEVVCSQLTLSYEGRPRPLLLGLRGEAE
jgi:hypothetical protein